MRMTPMTLAQAAPIIITVKDLASRNAPGAEVVAQERLKVVAPRRQGRGVRRAVVSEAALAASAVGWIFLLRQIAMSLCV